MQNTTLKQTALTDIHRKLKARLVPFAGFEMPVQYTSVIDEARATRKSAGLFDVSHMGQFRLKGKNVLEKLDALLTNNLSKLPLHKAQYNLMCKPSGFTLDDLIVYHRNQDELYVCVNASNIEKDFNWMKSHLDSTIDIQDESDTTSLIALQGPLSEAIVSQIGDKKVITGLPYYAGIDTELMGYKCYLARTGYTGEDGFEIYLPNENAAPLWEKLMEIGTPEGLLPCGLGARDVLRLEMGYPLYGHELDDSLSPYSANLGWVIKLQTESDFIGKEALASQKEDDTLAKMHAFVVTDRRQARQGCFLIDEGGKRIGMVTSGAFSPHLNAPIALGLMEPHYQPDTPVFADIRGVRVPMRQAKLPFVASKTKQLP